MPPAPDRGTVGRPSLLVSNCWDMSLKPKTVFMYDAEVLRLWRFDNETHREIELRTTASERRKLLGVIVEKFVSILKVVPFFCIAHELAEMLLRIHSAVVISPAQNDMLFKFGLLTSGT